MKHLGKTQLSSQKQTNIEDQTTHSEKIHPWKVDRHVSQLPGNDESQVGFLCESNPSVKRKRNKMTGSY